MDTAFVDTGPLFEFGTAQDPKLYEKSKNLLTSPAYRWYSSTYVFDELMTLMIQRVPKTKVLAFGEKLRASARLIWLHPSPEDEEDGWKLFRSHSDKLWSFTDCVSLHLIRKQGIDAVLSFDRDFLQMGLRLL